MMVNIFILALLPLVGLCSDLEGNLSGDDEPSAGSEKCIDLGNATKVAHVGWPFHFECDDIITPAKSANISLWIYYYALNATVTLRNPDGSTSWSMNDTSYRLRYYDKDLPYTVFEVQQNMTALFEMIYQIPEIGYCSKMNFYLDPQQLDDNSTCNHPFRPQLPSSAAYEGPFTIHCSVTAGEYPKLYVDPVDLEYEWWYNCSKNLPNNIDMSAGNLITISDVDYYNAGEYTCAVKYKEQRRFISTHSLCIKRGNPGIYTIKCNSEKVEARKGEHLNVTCIADFGKGDSFFYHYVMTWSKKNASGVLESICSARPRRGLQNSTSGDPRIQCENVKVNPTGKCFTYHPSPEELKSLDNKFRLTMLIKNFQLSDAGSYTLEFRTASNDFQEKSLEIFLNEDSILIALAVGISAAILLFLVLFIVLFIWRRKRNKTIE